MEVLVVTIGLQDEESMLVLRGFSCDPVDCNPPGASVHGTLQARILAWVAMPSSRGSSNKG